MHRHHYDAEYGRLHRIFDSNIDFVPGEFIYWDSISGKYLKAVEGKCDLLVLHVDECGTWFEGVNYGEIQLNRFDLKGSLFIDSNGDLTNEQTTTKVGFIENGNLYLSIVKDAKGAVNADWNATGGLAEILNKPSLFSGSYLELTDLPALFSGDYNELTNNPSMYYRR